MKTSRSMAARGFGMLLIVWLCVSTSFLSAQFSDVSYFLGNDILPYGSPHGDGISFYDFNNDGWDDLSISNGSSTPRFYVNNNGILESAPFSIPNIPAQNISMILWADYDNDGDADLLLTKFGAPLQLWNNDGSFNFTEVSSEAGIMNGNFYHVGAAFADYDHDGFLDLYVSKFYHPVFNPGEQHEGKLYRNNGDGTFSDATVSAGVYLPPRPCFQPVFLDYNNDGWEDLFLVIDRVSWPNELFRNNGDGTFTSVTDTSGFGFNICSMTGTVTDYDHDQDLDIYITNNPPVGNVFMENNGDGSFTDVASETGVHLIEVSWGSLWIDYDNDSWEDLFVSVTSPVLEPVGNHYYINHQGENFTIENNLFGNENDSSETFVCAKGDINNDGYYDFAINNQFPYPAKLYENNGGDNNYLSLTLNGTVSNKDGIGTWIHCFAGGNHYVRYTLCGENLIAQNSRKIIFGLGSISTIDSLVLEWNMGLREVAYNLLVNNHYHFIEGTSAVVPYDITSSGSNYLCPGDTLVLDAGDYAGYLWNTGSEDRYISITEPGTYQVTITTIFGVEGQSNPLEIIEAPEALVEFLVDEISCFGESDGSIWLEVSTSPMEEIVWNSGQMGQFIDNLDSGVYYFNGIDSYGCHLSDTTEIIEPDSLWATTAVQGVLCFNGKTGSVEISITGGVEPYFYNWNGINPNALSVGDYSVDVVDWNFCMLQIDFTIAQPDSLYSLVEVENEVQGIAGGSAELQIFGGVTPYQINWSTGITDTTYISNLVAGDYMVAVLDNNSCAFNKEFEVDFVSSLNNLHPSDNHYLIYPNPANGYLRIDCNRTTALRIELFDLGGKRILYEPTALCNVVLSTAHLNPGIYLLRVTENNNPFHFPLAIVR